MYKYHGNNTKVNSFQRGKNDPLFWWIFEFKSALFSQKVSIFLLWKKKKDFRESATKKVKSVINAFASLKKSNARKKANSIYKSLELGLESQTGCNKIRLLEQGVFSERKPFKTGQRVVVKGLHLRYQEFFAKKSEN